MMPSRLSRRSLLGRTAGAAAAAALAPSVMASTRPEKPRLAFVGVWNRGKANLMALANQEVVALCDVDTKHLANAQGALGERGKGARTYADFREMIDGEARNLDGVVVSTPDHTHAPAAAAALRAGLHVYCEKPLTHSVEEVRTLQALARKKSLVTQMGTQIHAGDNYRRVVELIRAGAIGDVRSVHVWSGKGWANGRYGKPQEVPGHLAWDLWLGPTPERDYTAGLHPASWRNFWAYGGGTLADMACHYVDLVHWALELDVPERIEASGPELHADGAPHSLKVVWHHPARAKRPAVAVHWYDGDARPTDLDEWSVVREGGAAWGAGQLWIGTKGLCVSDYGKYVLLPEADFRGFEPPLATIEKSIGHHAEWVRGITDGAATTCNFEYSGALSETVLLGCAAFRLGGELEWDRKAGRPRKSGVEDLFLAAEYREGWSL
ncbi:MAG: Gfo/Idh/MocA family oxidoreductase [bacterium]|nr:Gfo/Idh/MocA family oxidoreductase [bacterium]